jgi:hypothetical protein
MNIPRTIFPRVVRQSQDLVASLFLAAVTTMFATETTLTTSEILAKEIGESFHYTPVTGDDLSVEKGTLAGQTETLTLDKVVVTRYNDNHKLELLLTDQAKRIREESFSWKNGGTLLKKTGRTVTTELKLKFGATHKGWDVINFSW